MSRPTDVEIRVDSIRRLRQRAEELLAQQEPPDLSTLSADELVGLARELRLHRAELDMQNDELRRAHAELRESERRYRALHEFAPVGYITLDEVGHVLESNWTAARMLGQPSALNAGEDFSTFVSPAHQDSWFLWRRSLKGASRAVFELQLRRADGTSVYVDVVAQAAREREEPASTGVRLALLDVTARRRLELASRDGTARIERLFDALPVLISYVDRDQRYTFVNAAHETWFGIPPHEIAGRSVRELLGEVAYAWIRVPLEAALAGKAGLYQGAFPDFSGATRSVSVTLACDLDASGELNGAYCLIQDMSALHHAEGELRHLAADAALAEQRERSNLAFELHDDVGQILSYASIKLRELRADEASRSDDILGELANLMVQARERISSLSFQLDPPVLYDRGLRAAAEWLAEEVRWMHRLSVEVEEGPALDDLDESTRVVLFRALRELVLNVSRHSGVTQARVALRRDRAALEIEVSDQGVGFDASTTPGFGLGGMHRRITQLGGEVSIESQPGAGTRVRIRLPHLAQPTEPQT